jgi:hypothetical protein
MDMLGELYTGINKWKAPPSYRLFDAGSAEYNPICEDVGGVWSCGVWSGSAKESKMNKAEMKRSGRCVTPLEHRARGWKNLGQTREQVAAGCYGFISGDDSACAAQIVGAGDSASEVDDFDKPSCLANILCKWVNWHEYITGWDVGVSGSEKWQSCWSQSKNADAGYKPGGYRECTEDDPCLKAIPTSA